MKTKYVLLVLISFIVSGISYQIFFRNTKLFLVKTIAIQPMGYIANYEPIEKLKIKLEKFYHKKVVILPTIPLSSKYIDGTKGLRYDAGKIVSELSANRYAHYDKVIGYTESDIFIYRALMKESEFETMEINDAWGIFGLGDKPGRACVLSNYRLQDQSDSLMQTRIETVALHEVGHTLGLNHCTTPGCIMNGSYKSVENIDYTAGHYCSLCKRKLYSVFHF